MMKRSVRMTAVLLVLVLCLSLLPTSALAAGNADTKAGSDIIDSGTCGTNLTWTLTSDGLLTISGTGPMKDYDYYQGGSGSSYVPWAKHYQRDGSYYYSSYSCLKIKKVVIEDGVTSIGSYAFSRMTKLDDVTLPESLTSIGYRAFYYDDALKTCSLPNGLQNIGSGAFCFSGLTSVSIPSTTEEIGASAFYQCRSLETVELSSGLKTIGSYAFGYCIKLSGITIPDSVTAIGEGAFTSCEAMKYATLPSALEKIEADVFFCCISLEDVSIPATVTEIKTYAFRHTAITNLVIPDSVETIGTSAFSHCAKLEQVTLPSQLQKLERAVFWRCTALKQITLPDTVTEIGRSAFSACSSLESIVIPASVTKIDERAFTDCKALKTVDYLGSREQWDQINLNTYKNYYLLRIVSYQLPYCSVSLNRSTYSYTGEPVTPTVTVKTLNGTKLKKDTNYTLTYENNTEIGTASVTVTGIGKYSGTVTLQFDISEYVDLTDCRIKTTYTVYGCTGLPITPKLRVRTPDGQRLNEGEHYSVSYENNTDCGTATATVTGINGHTGTARYTFRIVPARVKNLVTATRMKNALEFTWDPAPCATQYRVYVNGVLTAETIRCNIMLTGLNANRGYRIKVRAVIPGYDEAGKPKEYVGNSAEILAYTL